MMEVKKYEHIICDIKQNVGILTLNSPKSLNSLSVEMIIEMRDILNKWKTDESISCLFVQGAGEKALCAGGNVRSLYDELSVHPEPHKLNDACLLFFVNEYSLDYEMHRYPKPVVVWANGIVMGGGIGCTNGASHKVVTEHSVLAMPEITIGLYPDVGATYFLNKLPHGTGNYLGMSANRINAADALYLKMADFYLPSTKKDVLLNALTNTAWTCSNEKNKELATSVLTELCTEKCNLHSKVKEHEDYLSKFENIESAIQFKEILSSCPHKDDWLEAGQNIFETGSPSSAHVILEQLNRGKNKSLEEIFRSELNLSLQFCMRPDFVEGVRALLVDKDKQPKWNPTKLEDVTGEMVQSYFEQLWDEGMHPLRAIGNSST